MLDTLNLLGVNILKALTDAVGRSCLVTAFPRKVNRIVKYVLY